MIPAIRTLAKLRKQDYFRETCFACRKQFRGEFDELIGKGHGYYKPICWKCSLQSVENRLIFYKKRVALLESWKKEIEEWKSKPENARYLMAEVLD